MKKNLFTNVGVNLVLAVALAACGSSGSGNPQNGDALTLSATALNNKTVVAAAPKTKVDTLLAFLSGKEAVAAFAPGDCGAGNDVRRFDLSATDPNGPFVCLTEALLVYEEIELENEGGSGTKDELEAGPFLVDLIGIADDGIQGEVSLNVPNGTFTKLELKVGDLDDRDRDGSLDDNGTDVLPANVALTDLNAAGMAGKSLKITGTAHDGLGGAAQPFTFMTNIEGKLEMPITVNPGETTVVDGSTIVTFIDLNAGFSKLALADITATMDGSFGNETESCSNATTAQRLACDIVSNVELFHDVNDDRRLDDGERRRGGDRGAVAFDDNPGGRD